MTERIILVIERVQRMYKKDGLFYVTEDRDWLVVMQWMQDHGLFQSNPERPPMAKFAHWVDEHVTCYLTSCNRPAMSIAFQALEGARYPWKGTQMSENILVRWRKLYLLLNKIWEESSASCSLHENTFNE